MTTNPVDNHPDPAEVFQRVREVAASIRAAGPMIAKIEVSITVWAWLRELATYPRTPPRAWEPNLAWGVPVQIDPTLAAGTWRVLDTEGQVMHQGSPWERRAALHAVVDSDPTPGADSGMGRQPTGKDLQ